MKPAAGWYPANLEFVQGHPPAVVWQHLEGVPFTDPFFEDTLRRARHPDKPLIRTTLTELPQWPAPPFLVPRAFIFHASRCGSTLLAQLIGQVTGAIVIAEPPVLDAVFRAPVTMEEQPELVLHTIRWLAQIRQEGDQHFFIKPDSWHLPWLPLIRQIFPDTPCWFLYRHPVEILWSHHRQRGSQMVPGWLPPSLFGIPADALDPADLDGYAAQVLAAIFHQAVLAASDSNLTLLNYQDLRQDPEGMLGRLGFALEPEEKRRIAERCHYHSKNGGMTFTADAESVIPAATRRHLEALVAPRLVRLFDHLEKLRNGGLPGINE